MKNLFIAIVVAFTSLQACSNKSKTEVAAVYQCPMKCEGEKTYDKPGKCPVCGMDLAEVKPN